MSYAAFWTASYDGSSWYRATQPAAALGWRGHQTWCAELLPASVVAKADAIVGSRVATEDASSQWAAMKAAGKRLVLDLDDDYFGVEERNTNAYGFWSKPDVQARLIRNTLLADVVTVASDRIGNAVARALSHRGDGYPVTDGWPTIVTIENGLHAGMLAIPRDYDPGVLTIGWAGTASTANDFDLVVPALDKIMHYCRRIGRKARLLLVGLPSGHPGLHQLGAEHDVHHCEWAAPVENYHSVISQFDIWVAPYRSNSFTDAKFPTKALEAGMFGIPLIASDIPPYAEWGREVLTVPSDQPWMWGRYLKNLVDRAEDRRARGEAARARASRNILQGIAGQWEQVLFP